MIRHGFEELRQGVEERVLVKAGVEPDLVGGQCRCEVCHCELVVSLALETDRIGQLVLVEVYDFRQADDFDRRQGREFREIEHIAAE